MPLNENRLKIKILCDLFPVTVVPRMRIQYRGYQAIFAARERKKEGKKERKREREREREKKKKDGEQNRKIQREYKRRNGTHRQARAQRCAQWRFRREGRGGFSSQVRRYVHVGIRALDWRRPASREGRDASQERTLILNRGPSCSERQFNERVFRGRITVVHTTDSRYNFNDYSRDRVYSSRNCQSVLFAGRSDAAMRFTPEINPN